MPARILAVDDDPDIIMILRLILEAAGYEVEEAAGPREALEQVYACQPDLILLDLMMPCEAEGLVFVRQLRSTYPEQLAQIPIIIVSGALDIHPRRPYDPVRPDLPNADAFQLVQGMLHKPPDPHLLVQTVRRVLAETLRADVESGQAAWGIGSS